MKKMLKSMINPVLSGKTRIILLFTLLLMVNMVLIAQAPEWLWATHAGGTNIDVGNGIALDDAGNSYVTGHFFNTATFGSYSLTSSGDYDIFVAKIDADGNWLWVTQAGGTGMDVGTAISIDDAGNSYVTGLFTDTATFGSYSLTSNGSYDIFVANMDDSGNWLWATQAGGTYYDRGLEITIDDAGNSYVTGYFEGTATFGSDSLTSSGYSDIFVAKMDDRGNWLWATQAGGNDDDNGNGIAVDYAGNSYVTGYFEGTATFGSFSITSNGPRDIFVAKMDDSGNWLWAIQAGGSNRDEGNAIAIDDAGNIYVTGYFRSTATFGSYSLTSNGFRDIFITKIDAHGNWQWASQAGGSGLDEGIAISIDDAGKSYVTGRFRNTATFGSYTITGSGPRNIFVAKMDYSGNWLWTTQAGGTGWDEGTGISIDDAGNSYVTGWFTDTATFGSYTLTNTNSGYEDIFVAKLNSTLSAENEISPTINILSNYPNPFNPSTTISFSLTAEDAENAELIIYNLKGQKVKQLVSNSAFQQSAGQHSVIWNGKDDNGKPVSSGIYFYKLKTDNFEKTRKMISMK